MLDIHTLDSSIPFSSKSLDSPSKNTITAIKPAVRDRYRINVFVDGKFRLSLTLSQFSDANLKLGQTLSEKKISELESESNFGKLYQSTLEYVLTRPHSEKEVRDYLTRKQNKRILMQRRYDEFQERLKNDPEYREKVKDIRAKTREKNAKLNAKDFTEDNRFEYRGRAKTNLPTKPGAPISDSDINRTIAKLKENRAIDDAEFARYFVENRHRLKGTSLKKLKLELKQKGISDQLISDALSADEYGDILRDERAELIKVIEKKRSKYAPFENPTTELAKKNRQKLIQYLLRQGFPYDLLTDVLREMDSQS